VENPFVGDADACGERPGVISAAAADVAAVAVTGAFGKLAQAAKVLAPEARSRRDG